jgi:multidrug efflux pump subunit AcrA (membrane-fusion protein)
MHSFWKKSVLGLVLTTVGGLLVAGAGCTRSGQPLNAPEQKALPRPEVGLVKPERVNIGVSLSRPGYVEAFEETAMYAKLAGYVAKVNVDIGAKVGEGDVLAELSIPEMVVELTQKDALVLQAQANLGSSEAKVKEAEAGILRAQADVRRWDVEQKRQAKMVRNGVIDKQSLDATQAQLETSQAAEAEAKAQVAKARADVRAAERTIQVAQANKKYIEAMLQYTKIKAPYTGVVVTRNLNKGDFVQPAGGSGRKSGALFVLARTDRGVRIFVDVPEAATPWIKDKIKATVRVRTLPGLEVEGEVTRSAWALDPKSRTLKTEIDVKKPGELRPGTYAYVTLTTEHKKVWTLPSSAVVQKDNEVYCFRVHNGKALKTPLQIGLNNGQRVEVLKIQRLPAKGGRREWDVVSGKETIVQGNLEKLTNGQIISDTSSKR